MVEFEYPHNVIITRETNTGFPEDSGVPIDVYIGECDAQVGASGETSLVVDCDYTVFISSTSVEIKRSDKVAITFNPTWNAVEGTVKQKESVIGFGTTIWVTEYGN